MPICLGFIVGCTGAIEDREDVGVVSSALLGVADCPAGYNVIQGTSSNNTLNGTAGNDCILGLGGNDTINGNGGNDFLVGGIGNDTIRGGDGNDVLHGEDGTDRLEGQNHDDTLYGGIAVDTLLGGNNNDLIYGGDANDIIDGNAGNDTVYGGAGADEISGGDGNDRLFGEADGDYLYGDGGDDILNGGDGGDECWAGDGNDVVTGGPGSDALVGDAGNDFLADSGSNVFIHGGDGGTDSCTGFSCELPPPTQNGCTVFGQCAASQTCVADVGMCVPCGTVGGVGCNTGDNCPSDPNKTEPGICGCGVADADSDGDGTADCNDGCASDPAKIAAGICGCGVADTDSDGDGTANCNDACASDPAKIAVGICGCGVADTDSDADGTANCLDGCASDPAKTAAGICGCGVADTDSDADGTANCLDACPSDPAKIATGVCGCGVADTDSDADGTADCNDECPLDPETIGPCGVATSFETIAELDGFRSQLTAVDADGSTVVGFRVVSMAAEGFRYDTEDGLVVLDGAHPSAQSTYPVEITADGQTVIGYSSWFSLGANNQGALWNALGEVTRTTASTSAIPTWIAANGERALGFLTGAREVPQAYNDILTVTASIPATVYIEHRPVAGSSDGSVVLLNRKLSNGTYESVIYNSPTFGFANVIPHRAGSSSQYFADMAPDGSVVVGRTIGLSRTEAVAWAWSAGYLTIPGLGACSDSDAIAVAQGAAGLRVVGHCDGQAFIWDENGATRILTDALIALGITPPADAWLHVEDISADGSTLVGYTIDYADDNERHAWIVRLGDDYTELP